MRPGGCCRRAHVEAGACAWPRLGMQAIPPAEASCSQAPQVGGPRRCWAAVCMILRGVAACRVPCVGVEQCACMRSPQLPAARMQLSQPKPLSLPGGSTPATALHPTITRALTGCGTQGRLDPLRCPGWPLSPVQRPEAPRPHGSPASWCRLHMSCVTCPRPLPGAQRVQQAQRSPPRSCPHWAPPGMIHRRRRPAGQPAKVRCAALHAAARMADARRASRARACARSGRPACRMAASAEGLRALQHNPEVDRRDCKRSAYATAAQLGRISMQSSAVQAATWACTATPCTAGSLTRPGHPQRQHQGWPGAQLPGSFAWTKRLTTARPLGCVPALPTRLQPVCKCGEARSFAVQVKPESYCSKRLRSSRRSHQCWHRLTPEHGAGAAQQRPEGHWPGRHRQAGACWPCCGRRRVLGRAPDRWGMRINGTSAGSVSLRRGRPITGCGAEQRQPHAQPCPVQPGCQRGCWVQAQFRHRL